MVLYAPQRIVPESGLELGILSSVVLHATAKPILRGVDFGLLVIWRSLPVTITVCKKLFPYMQKWFLAKTASIRKLAPLCHTKLLRQARSICWVKAQLIGWCADYSCTHTLNLACSNNNAAVLEWLWSIIIISSCTHFVVVWLPSASSAVLHLHCRITFDSLQLCVAGTTQNVVTEKKNIFLHRQRQLKSRT